MAWQAYRNGKALSADFARYAPFHCPVGIDTGGFIPAALPEFPQQFSAGYL
jgi:hypothetical protein